MTLVTRDATSLRWIPQSAAEWTSLLSGTGISNPASVYGCQEASGNALDLIGSRNLASSGSPAYRQPVTGWSSVSLKPGTNSTDFFGGASTGVDLHTSSALLLMFLRINAAPASQSCLAFMGGSNDQVLFLMPSGKIDIDLNGSVDVTGAVNVANSTILLALQVDITHGVARAYVNGVEVLTPTWQGVPAAGATDLFIGGVDLNWPDASLLYASYFTGAAAEIDTAHGAILIDRLQNGPAVTSIAVTPAPFTLATIGATQQLTATATRADGSTYDATATSTWSSSAPSIATVSSTGLVTAVAPGSATITAAFTSLGASAASGTSLCMVGSSVILDSITIAPTSTTIDVTGAASLVATGHYSDSSTANVTATATWTSSDPTVATVVAGVVTAVKAGAVTITAAVGLVSGTTSVSVAPPNAYARMMAKLLPPGKIWRLFVNSTLSTLLAGCADELGRLEGRTLDLLREAIPSSAVELLPEYESELALDPPQNDYPKTTADMRAAVGYGTWSAGWLCDELSGSLQPVFGAPAFSPVGSPVYGTAGPRGGADLAIGFAGSADAFSGGNVFDVGDADDFAFFWIGRFVGGVSLAKFTNIFSKDIALIRCYVIQGSGQMVFELGTGGSDVHTVIDATQVGSNWYAGAAVLDRGTGKFRNAAQVLSSPLSVISDEMAAPVGLSNANNFLVGNDNVGAQGVQIAAFYVAVGAGAATGMSANLSTALANFAGRVSLTGSNQERQSRIVSRLTARQRFRPVDFQTALAPLLGQTPANVVVLERSHAFAASIGDDREIYRFFIYRDPTQPGAYFLTSAQELVNAIKPSHTIGTVIESVSALYDDPHSLYDRDLMGA